MSALVTGPAAELTSNQGKLPKSTRLVQKHYHVIYVNKLTGLIGQFIDSVHLLSVVYEMT
jgi:hypothetical protein